FAIFHGLRGNARERLGLSAGLRGNGMCFTTTLLRDVPHNAYSLVEDVEYGIRLGRAGHRVAHVHEAKVRGDMVAGEGASRSQRRRWEEGRRALVNEQAWPLLRDGLLQRDKVLLDLAIDLLIPPLSTLAVGTAVGMAASLAYASVAGPRRGALAALPWLASGGLLGLYVLRGTALSGLGARGYADLAFAPLYVGWKLVLKATQPSSPKGEWVRTERGK
ncbi:MAG TPA: glycosyltransferase, partial [Polyangiaceae bacterium]